MTLTTHKTVFLEDLLTVLNARTPLAEFVSPPSLQAEAGDSDHSDSDDSAQAQTPPPAENQNQFVAVPGRPVSDGDHQMEDEENEKDLEPASIHEPETEKMEV